MTQDDTHPLAPAALRDGVRITLGHLDEAFRSILRDDGEPDPADACIEGRAHGGAFRTCDGPLPDDCAAISAGRGSVA